MVNSIINYNFEQLDCYSKLDVSPNKVNKIWIYLVLVDLGRMWLP